MLSSIRKYIIDYFYRKKTLIEVDNDFYEFEEFYLIDLEVEKNV